MILLVCPCNHCIRDQPIMLYFYPLCYAAELLKFTYYVQEQELLSDYVVIYLQFCMSNLLHVADNF